MNDSPDRRPPLVVAAEWTSRITGISLEMVLPGIAGFGIGYYVLGSMIWAIVLLMLGVALGMTVGIIHLARLTSPTGSDARKHQESSDDDSELSPKA